MKVNRYHVGRVATSAAQRTQEERLHNLPLLCTAEQACACA